MGSKGAFVVGLCGDIVVHFCTMSSHHSTTLALGMLYHNSLLQFATQNTILDL